MRIARAAGAAIEDDHESAGVLDAGVAHRVAQGRPRRLSASRARPLQARADRGEQRGPPLRRRGGVVSRLRSRHASRARDGADHPGVARLRRAFLHNTASGRIPPRRESVGWAVANGYLVEARTAEALAKAIGVDAAGLTEEIARNNRYAETGEDQDFGKGSTEFDRNNGDPKHGPNPCIGPIAKPPYYAMAVYPSTLGSSIGLKADADGRVLDAQGNAIPGCSPAATTWRRSCAALIRAPASRSDPRWCSPGAPRWRWPGRVPGPDPLKSKA